MIDYLIIALIIINVVLTILYSNKNNDSKKIVDNVNTFLQNNLQVYINNINQIQKDNFERQLQQFDKLNEQIEKNNIQLEKILKDININQINSQDRQFILQDKRMKEIAELLSKAQNNLQKAVATSMLAIKQNLDDSLMQTKVELQEIRNTVSNRLEVMSNDNKEQLDKMRNTVDEKLQKTLENKITQSFQLVNERLQEVYSGLGEMKSLASGVGDLKKVLTNVKTRGIIGEYQLKAIIDDILTKDQYEENFITKKGSNNRVEFAVKLPGNENPVYLPIDAKFPVDAYNKLQDAYETSDSEKILLASKELQNRIKGFAKDIKDKYIDTPNTTEFAIMFLPFEGLYAEVCRDGLIDELQQKYRINIAGPTTISALLNSLQMGFKTLAIHKRSSEVWNVLSEVKKEFETFENTLEKAQQRIEQTSIELDKLVGVRTRKINNKLKNVTEISDDNIIKIDSTN